ncbi:MAG: S9 family peptidase, partial [Candidatus Krumholzibacteria bacterium]|nr:S9 family peptidase [Candidatus Krumholzibacteria bacterium]
GMDRDTTSAVSGEQEKARLHIENWLLLGPIDSPLPAFHDEGQPKIDAAYMLSYEDMALEEMNPVKGKKVALLNGRNSPWKAATADTGSLLIPTDASLPQIAYLATYIETGRWMKIDLEAHATHPFKITVDGNSVMKLAKVNGNSLRENRKTGSAKIGRGKHLLMAKTVYVPGDTAAEWRLDVRIKVDAGLGETPALSLCPSENLSLGHILDVPHLEGAGISPDGDLVAVTMSRFIPPEGKTEKWVEIRRFQNGKLARTIRDVSNITDVQWAPVGKLLSYKTSGKDKGTIRSLDLETGSLESIVEDVTNLGHYTWGPDGTFIIYSVTEKPKPDKKGVKRLRAISDRWNHGRDRSSLYISSFPGGVTRRLTAGKHDTYVQDIHPDGRTLLVTRRYEDLSNRPYDVTELIITDLENQGTELLWKGPWLRRALWSPDGSRILILAGPSTFGDTGRDLPEGKIPNDYDTQAYILDPENNDIEPVTKNFDPAIVSAHWSRSNGYIYFVAEEGSYVRLYRYNPKNKNFKRIDLGFDIIERGSNIALNKPLASLIGSSVDHPARLYAVDLIRGKAHQILDPSYEKFRYVRLGKVDDWSFTGHSGDVIEGRIYYPPDFDPQKTYPCIIYYYGGTSPTNRSFGGRYPKNLWASMGYVVYVLQPSGATGFGQEFSTRHVNDWGKVVAEEIIDGVIKFLGAHPFVDRERVGCIGASYGGFMTQLLVTKTDIFAAAVSHAGISSITSYWGIGYWGYAYNAVSAANSFPWNRKDIYIELSPLFAADKIDTPLLLLHGASDTNVPPGESNQMYIALKLLGKEVEYVRFADQNHFILDYKKRKIWSNTIVSWFDRWLKGEPEWWNDLYPPLDTGPQSKQEGTKRPALVGHR